MKDTTTQTEVFNEEAKKLEEEKLKSQQTIPTAQQPTTAANSQDKEEEEVSLVLVSQPPSKGSAFFQNISKDEELERIIALLRKDRKNFNNPGRLTIPPLPEEDEKAYQKRIDGHIADIQKTCAKPVGLFRTKVFNPKTPSAFAVLPDDVCGKIKEMCGGNGPAYTINRSCANALEKAVREANDLEKKKGRPLTLEEINKVYQPVLGQIKAYTEAKKMQGQGMAFNVEDDQQNQVKQQPTQQQQQVQASSATAPQVTASETPNVTPQQQTEASATTNLQTTMADKTKEEVGQLDVALTKNTPEIQEDHTTQTLPVNDGSESAVTSVVTPISTDASLDSTQTNDNVTGEERKDDKEESKAANPTPQIEETAQPKIDSPSTTNKEEGEALTQPQENGNPTFAEGLDKVNTKEELVAFVISTSANSGKLQEDREVLQKAVTDLGGQKDKETALNEAKQKLAEFDNQIINDKKNELKKEFSASVKKFNDDHAQEIARIERTGDQRGWDELPERTTQRTEVWTAKAAELNKLNEVVERLGKDNKEPLVAPKVIVSDEPSDHFFTPEKGKESLPTGIEEKEDYTEEAHDLRSSVGNSSTQSLLSDTTITPLPQAVEKKPLSLMERLLKFLFPNPNRIMVVAAQNSSKVASQVPAVSNEARIKQVAQTIPQSISSSLSTAVSGSVNNSRITAAHAQEEQHHSRQ